MEIIVLLFIFTIFLFTQFDFFRHDVSWLLHPFFWVSIFYFLIFLLKPFVSIIFDFHFVYDYMGFYPDSFIFIKSALVAFTWFIVLYIVLRSTFHLRPRQLLPCNDELLKKSAFYTVMLLLPIAIYSTYKTFGGVAIDGRIGSIIMERVNGIAINTSTTGYLTDAKNIFVGLIILTFGVWGKNKWTLSLLIVFVFFRVYQGWGRWALVFTIIALLLLYISIKNHKFIQFKHFAIIIVLGLVFNLLGENRYYLKEVITGEIINERYYETDKTILESLDSLDFANFDYLMFVVDKVPDKSGTYTYGLQYLQIFTEPVPRILWKNKPVGPPFEVVNLNDYGNFYGLTVSMPGDAWMTGGFLGVVIVTFLFALFVRAVFLSFIKHSNNVVTTLPYLLFLPLLLQWFRDGGFVSIFKFYLFTMLPFIIWYLIYIYLKKTQSRS